MTETEITLNQALELQVQKAPAKVFISHRDVQYTYEHTLDIVNRLAAYLTTAGIRAEDKICIMLPRTPELILLFLAATKIGAYPSPANYLLGTVDVADTVKRINPKVLVSSARLISADLDTALNWTKELLRIDIDNTKEDWLAWQDVIKTTPQPGSSTAQSGDVAYLNYTTGSSGVPKGALATHANIYWNTRSAVETFSLSHDDVHLCMFASFAHPHELFARALYTGASLVLLEEINPKTIVRTINLHSVTCMMGLAPMYEMMATRCTSMTIPSLRIAESGGMFTRQGVNTEFKRQFDLVILSVWGSTETTGVALANNLSSYRTDGSMGKVCPDYQVKLLGDDGDEVASGEVGELFFKGPAVVTGYDDHLPLLDDDQWYASGDMARMDEDGFYYFIERKSGMIKVVGLKVYPLQVELILIEHPRITEIAVLGVADRRKGFVPKAFVAIQGEEKFDSDDILTFCKDKMPAYMIPKQIEIMESLPKIGSGKINKKALAE